MEQCSCAILPYSTDPLDHLSFHGHPKNKLFLGVELEVECSGVSPSEKASDWRDHASDWLICKHDGSLSHGFEIVTAPSSLDVHQAQWTALLEDARLRAGLKSWDTTTCGMHVHMSRDAISALTLGKMLVFLNSRHTYDHIVALAGRSDNHWAAFGHKCLHDAYTVQKDARGRCTHARRVPSHDRYEALNLTNSTTVELRIFKGTLDLAHVLANIEFCHALVCWAQDASIRDIESWQSFWTYIEKNKKIYSHLFTYVNTLDKKEVA